MLTALLVCARRCTRLGFIEQPPPELGHGRANHCGATLAGDPEPQVRQRLFCSMLPSTFLLRLRHPQPKPLRAAREPELWRAGLRIPVAARAAPERDEDTLGGRNCIAICDALPALP